MTYYAYTDEMNREYRDSERKVKAAERRKKRYAVQQRFFNGWGEAWPYDPADRIPPDRYKTRAAAQAAIDDFFKNGEVVDYGRDEFRIVEVIK